jgi:hypothetical protein
MSGPEHRQLGLLVACALLAACGGASISELRFHNRAPIEAIDDTTPISKPDEREQGERAWQIDALLHVPLDHALSIPGPQHARDVNALDELPRSSWFEPRIAMRALTPQEIACGPAGCERARTLASARFTIKSAKKAGTAPGFLVKCDVGRYLLKIDTSAPEAETGADIVVQRLLWAAGYHVPSNEVVYLARDQLTIDPEAKLTDADVDEVLAPAPRDAAGRIRVLLSEFLEGKPIGGFPMLGVRRDDPNDAIPHQHRRSLRGLELFFAWLGQTDVKEANTLDMWVPASEESQLGYVRHHQLDFGKALGTWGLHGRQRDAFAPHFDYADATSSLLSFGLSRWPWEDIKTPALRGVGRFEASRFDPAGYSPTNPYGPFLYTDRFDRYWAAKIIARFSPAQLEAAIAAGRYTDQAARVYLLSTLIARQRKAVAYGFSEVSTLDHFEVNGSSDAGFSLCARDLAVATRFARPEHTRYSLRVYDWDGEPIDAAEARAAQDGKVCVAGLVMGSTRDHYTMVAYETVPERGPPAHIVVHLALGPGSGRMRVIGIERR